MRKGRTHSEHLEEVLLRELETLELLLVLNDVLGERFQVGVVGLSNDAVMARM
jgi:hypothetical protein